MFGPSLLHTRTPRRTRGSILVIVLFVVSMLAGLAASAAMETSDLIEGTENAGKATRGEFAAESGIDFGMRRLALESEWNPTGPDPIEIGTETRFAISASLVDSGTGEGVYRVSSEGLSDGGRVELTGDVHVNYGVRPYADIAMAFLGDQLHMEGSTVIGDMLITDRANVVDNWIVDANGFGSWVEGGPYGPFDIRFDATTLNGDLYKYTETSYGIGADQYVISAHVRMPKFDLDQYIQSGSDRRIYSNTSNLRNVSHPETAVFILKPGHTLSLRGCNFPGGVVVHVDDEYNLRDGAQNKVVLKEGTRIGGGTGGVHPYLGLLAPATEIQYAGNRQATGGAGGDDDIYGFTMVNKIFQVENYQFNGQVIVINEVKHYRNTNLIFDPIVAENAPPGIEFGVPSGESDLVRLWEDYGP